MNIPKRSEKPLNILQSKVEQTMKYFSVYGLKCKARGLLPVVHRSRNI